MIDIKIDREINFTRNIKSIRALYNLMKRERYDIVHVHTPIAALLGRVAAKLAGINNIIYTAHGFYFHDEMSPKQYRFFYNIEKYAAKYLTDWLLLQSKEDYELALRDKFLSTDRTIHLSNGVDICSKFNPALLSEREVSELRSSLGISQDDFVFTFIGRMVKEKGIFELLEAFTELSNKKENVKLILIGGLSNTERDQSTYREIHRYLANGNIIYLGVRRDIPALLAACDVFVLPSYREGLPRSIIEAMAMGKPVIATNIRGCREEVFHEKNGYLVEKGSVSSLYNAMNKFSSDAKTVREFGKESRRIVEEIFDEEKVLEKQIRLFSKL